MNRILMLAALVAAALLRGAGASEASTPAGAQASSIAAALEAVDRASTVEISAYSLSMRTSMYRHLVAAAGRGARVEVIVTGTGMGYAVRDNERLAAAAPELHVRLTAEPLHVKALLAGGRVFLDDRNWATRSLVIELPEGAAAAVRRAIDGDATAAYGEVTFSKGASLRREAQLLATARSQIALESESFGAENPVYDALRVAARRGVAVRVLVNAEDARDDQREAAAISALERAGAHVAYTSATDKLAIVDGRVAWVGSSNASEGVQGQIDWGVTTTDGRMLRQIEGAFERATSRRYEPLHPAP
ncbi:MAG: phospholipase D-like domain-containing protein [Candidatus Baltobacteraceae bacterium]